ncbi:MAG TPA: hypothetical protein PLF01_00925 [Alphaproteobacteria bacterium]|nr:hypothetical protein [Alphaproteobacteria bacterium]
MSKADLIVQRLQELTSFIEDAQTKLQSGEVLSLSHLDDEVGQLCDQALNLPPQDAVKVQPVMANMISKLETLSIALKDFQSGLKAGK